MSFRKYLKCVFAVVAATILSGFLTTDVSVEMIMGLIGGDSDFEISDFYNRVDHQMPRRPENQLIYIVNIDSVYERADIAGLIDDIAACNPEVIGLDVSFSAPKDVVGDSILIDAVKRNRHKLVSALKLETNDYDLPVKVDNILTTSCNDNSFGAVNLIITRHKKLVRAFSAEFDTPDGPVPSFAYLVAKKYTDAHNKPLSAQGTDEHALFYSNCEFRSILPDKVAAESKNLEGKIVLIGTIKEKGDLHNTPIQADYPGVKIHAYIIDSMISGKYVSTTDEFLTWLLAIIISFALCMLYVWLEQNNAQNFVIRLSLVLIAVIGIILGYIFYSKFYISIDMIKILLLIALSQFFLDVWYAVKTGVAYVRKHSKASAIVILLMMPALEMNATGDYTISQINGKVTIKRSGKLCREGETVKGDEMLGLGMNRGLTLRDSNSPVLYTTDSREDATPEGIVNKINKENASVLKRLYKEVRQNLELKKHPSESAIGASERGDEDINCNTEFLFSLLNSVLFNGKDCAAENGISLTAHPAGGAVWWSIANKTPKPMFANLLIIPQNGAKPAFAFNCDPEMRSLLVTPGDEVQLKEMIFDTTGFDFCLVASDKPFDSEDINTFFLTGEEPLSFSEFPESFDRPSCCIVKYSK